METAAFEERPVSSLDKVFYAQQLDAPPLRRITAARDETGASNVVTSIVFDYRGFDTLGEASVLFTAVLGVGLVLRKLNAKEKREARDAEE